jgi:hypothetical protein
MDKNLYPGFVNIKNMARNKLLISVLAGAAAAAVVVLFIKSKSTPPIEIKGAEKEPPSGWKNDLKELAVGLLVVVKDAWVQSQKQTKAGQ